MGSINKYAKKRLEALEAEEGRDPKQLERLRAMEDAERNLVDRSKAPVAPPSPAPEDEREKKRKQEINDRLKRRQRTLDGIK